jgi:energy-coupling factor transporter transmembrane protein EcfT
MIFYIYFWWFFGILIFMIYGIFSKNKIIKKIATISWIMLFSLIAFFFVLKFFTTKMKLCENEIYGEYVIDKNKCAGKQADWQYNNYRFEIKKNNKIYFYITRKERIVKTIIKDLKFNNGHSSPFLDIDLRDSDFHILKENPTLYREIWTFYYVFHSEKFGNMFFTKGKWKSTE